jgi:hypothetical protein
MCDDDCVAPGVPLQYCVGGGEGGSGLGSLRQYQLREAVGQGTYGTVFRGVVRRRAGAAADAPDDVVALKKINRHHLSDGFPKTETREVKILKALRHPNMVRLREVRAERDDEAARRGTAVCGCGRAAVPRSSRRRQRRATSDFRLLPLRLPLSHASRRLCRRSASRRRTTRRTARRWPRPPPSA